MFYCRKVLKLLRLPYIEISFDNHLQKERVWFISLGLGQVFRLVLVMLVLLATFA